MCAIKKTKKKGPCLHLWKNSLVLFYFVFEYICLFFIILFSCFPYIVVKTYNSMKTFPIEAVISVGGMEISFTKWSMEPNQYPRDEVKWKINVN